MDQKLIIILLMNVLIGIGLYQAIIVYIYQTSINKTSYQNDACILTIFKSIINILNGIYIWRIFYLDKKENIYWKTLKLINIIIYIITITFCNNIRKYGIFMYVIILEISLYMGTILMVCLLLFLSYNGIIKINESNINKEVIINIPQIAVPANNIELEMIDIPQASIVKFNNATLM